mmetsp:Transcript_7187/g.21180  ORF Transcript_7187/g.21180 Transcript_7187/m.21180 type:complete len:242 (-) Transcript_7187:143-868(-)
MQRTGLAVATAAGVVALAAWLLRRRERNQKARRDGVPPPARPRAALTADAGELKKLLRVIEDTILPQTARAVSEGNKVFGAAILDADLNVVSIGTNHETACPLYHGEIRAIQQWSALDPKPASADCVFLATHEPCCLCVSGIVWSGFNRCFFLYPYETTRDQGIPHDLNIMHELWGVPRYIGRNRFCATGGVLPLIEALPDGPEKLELRATVERVTATYDALAHKYHAEKAANPDNDLAFN